MAMRMVLSPIMMSVRIVRKESILAQRTHSSISSAATDYRLILGTVLLSVLPFSLLLVSAKLKPQTFIASATNKASAYPIVSPVSSIEREGHRNNCSRQC